MTSPVTVCCYKIIKSVYISKSKDLYINTLVYINSQGTVGETK